MALQCPQGHPARRVGLSLLALSLGMMLDTGVLRSATLQLLLLPPDAELQLWQLRAGAALPSCMLGNTSLWASHDAVCKSPSSQVVCTRDAAGNLKLSREGRT